jgi:hypothetical protein
MNSGRRSRFSPNGSWVVLHDRLEAAEPCLATQRRTAKNDSVTMGPRPPKMTQNVRKDPTASLTLSVVILSRCAPPPSQCNRAGCPRGDAGRAVERGDLFRQLGLNRRHRAGRRQGIARRHHGPAQQLQVCPRRHRSARCGAGARLGGKRASLVAFGHLALITLTGLFLSRPSVQGTDCKPWGPPPPG